jgi:hypothetical protein
METTNETVVPEHYNPNQLVSYKVIDSQGGVSYPLTKVTEIEYQLENARYYQRVLDNQRSSIRSLEEALVGWLENDESAVTIVSEICEMFGFSPEKEIQFEATATITGTVSIPLSELADFDIDSLDLNVYVDSHSYNVDADIEVDHISVID